MKKLILLFISLLAVGAAFQSCDNTKTYAEMLEEERDGVNDFWWIPSLNVNPIIRDTINMSVFRMVSICRL